MAGNGGNLAPMRYEKCLTPRISQHRNALVHPKSIAIRLDRSPSASMAREGV